MRKSNGGRCCSTRCAVSLCCCVVAVSNQFEHDHAPVVRSHESQEAREHGSGCGHDDDDGEEAQVERLHDVRVLLHVLVLLVALGRDRDHDDAQDLNTHNHTRNMDTAQHEQEREERERQDRGRFCGCWPARQRRSPRVEEEGPPATRTATSTAAFSSSSLLRHSLIRLPWLPWLGACPQERRTVPPAPVSLRVCVRTKKNTLVTMTMLLAALRKVSPLAMAALLAGGGTEAASLWREWLVATAWSSSRDDCSHNSGVSKRQTQWTLATLNTRPDAVQQQPG